MRATPYYHGVCIEVGTHEVILDEDELEVLIKVLKNIAEK